MGTVCPQRVILRRIQKGSASMATKGSSFRAEDDPALRTTCLVGAVAGGRSVCPTCDACHEAGWRPAGFEGMA